jgi:hypothetical protein
MRIIQFRVRGFVACFLCLIEFKINEHMFCDLFGDDNISPDKGEYLLLIKYREKCKELVPPPTNLPINTFLEYPLRNSRKPRREGPIQSQPTLFPCQKH